MAATQTALKEQSLNNEKVLVDNQEHPHLANLINHLHHRIQNPDPLLRKIKNPRKLLDALMELHGLIGMDYVKISVSKQTSYLIKKLEKGETSLKLLNTAIYGNQGQGKTAIGVILAKIWYHLGFLETAKVKKDSQQNFLTQLSSNSIENIIPYLIAVVYVYIIVSFIYKDVMVPCYDKYYETYPHIFKYLIIVGVTICMILSLFYVRHTIQTLDTSMQIQDTKESDIITITSRSDFVSCYVGCSDKKTEQLLKDNRGKVVFIDEAYSLISGEHDQYGKEALNSINKWMSEHGEETVIIFAGYKDALEKTLFAQQIGLNRRVIWKFNIDDYNEEEFFKIFKLHVAKEKYKLLDSDEEKIKDLMFDYHDQFIDHAGSTEQLCFYSQLNHNSRNGEDGIITLRDVRVGLKELMTNQLKNEKKETSLFDELAKKFKG